MPSADPYGAWQADVLDFSLHRLAGPFYYQDLLSSRDCSDVNGDGRVTFGDPALIAKHATSYQGGSVYDSLYDLNTDLAVTFADALIAAKQASVNLMCPAES